MTPFTTIVGLGNPGRRYTHTRHNAGFFVVDALANHLGVSFRQQREAEEAKIDGVTLVKPLTFMNASGRVVQRYATKTKPERILVIHDDLDLPLGRLRFKFGGSSGGQRGVQDTISRIGKDFYRLKVGIDRPPAGWEVQRWVLSPFQDSEQSLLEDVVAAAKDAVLLALDQGVDQAMGDYNGRDLRHPNLPRPNATSSPQHPVKVSSRATQKSESQHLAKVSSDTLADDNS